MRNKTHRHGYAFESKGELIKATEVLTEGTDAPFEYEIVSGRVLVLPDRFAHTERVQALLASFKYQVIEITSLSESSPREQAKRRGWLGTRKTA